MRVQQLHDCVRYRLPSYFRVLPPSILVRRGPPCGVLHFPCGSTLPGRRPGLFLVHPELPVGPRVKFHSTVTLKSCWERSLSGWGRSGTFLPPLSRRPRPFAVHRGLAPPSLRHSDASPMPLSCGLVGDERVLVEGEPSSPPSSDSYQGQMDSQTLPGVSTSLSLYQPLSVR